MVVLVFAVLLGSPPARALDTGDISIVSLKGEVHVTMLGTERPVHVGSILELPATLRTGRDGAVELRQGATSVNIGPDTLLEFPALAMEGGPIDRIVQPRGNAFYSVGKRPGRKLRVETPLLVGVVKGTQFNVAVQGDSSTFSLFEGLLEIRAADESSVVDIRAGEIAARHRGDANIGVLKMDGKTPPPPPRAPAGTPGNTQNNPAPDRSSPVMPRASLADDDAGLRIPQVISSVTSFESAPVTSAPVGIDTGASVPGVAAAVDVPAGNVTLDVGAGASVAVDTGANTAGVAAAVEVPASNVSLDVAVAPSTVAADLSASAGVGAGTVAVDTGVSAGAGPALNTGTIAVDSNVTTGVALPAATANVDLGTSVSVNVPAANVDVGVSVGGVDLGASVDLGNGSSNSGPGNNNGNAGEGNNGNGKGNSGTGSLNSGNGNEVDVDSVLNGLLKKPGKK